jgi:hypothetical protein
VRTVAEEVLSDPKSAAIARVLWGDEGRDALELLCLSEALPFTNAQTYSERGLAVEQQWMSVWALQAAEDRGETIGSIRAAPKYDLKDFRSPSHWRLRGKLGVPKEHFISYPGCERDGDTSPLLGWAGWNDLQRAQALVLLYNERKDTDGWTTTRLMPMLVGLHELMFWLERWHAEPDAGGQRPAQEFKQFLDAELHAHKLTVDDLKVWRPSPGKSSRKGGAAERNPTASAEPDRAQERKPSRIRRRNRDVTKETP